MDRRRFLLTSLAGILAAPPAVEAQQRQSSARIGLLAPASLDRDVDGFLRGMRDLGYIEGHNLVIEYRLAEGRFARLPELFADLVRLKVAVIVTGGTAAALAAKQSTTAIPVVIGAMGDPVGTGVVSSLARPGGNITGLSLAMGEGFAGKYLELIREVVPKVSRVAVLCHPSMRAQANELDRAARQLGIHLQSIEIQQADQIDSAFAAIVAERARALIVTGDPFTFTHRVQIVTLATKYRLPAVYGLRAFVEAGGLLTYAASLPDLWRRAATYVDRILKGSKPGDLPIEQPTRFELLINMGLARTLGLTIPPSLLARADQIIE